MSMLTSVLAGERPTVQGRLADRAVHRHFLDTTNPRPKRPSVTRRAMATSPKVVTHSELAGKGDAAPVPVVAKSALPPDVNADDETHPREGFREYSDTTIPDGPTLGISRAGHVAIDLPILLRTRLLVTASSGGGKSYAVRRILEQTAPLVQQIVIDPEGEFDTLSERFPFAVFNNRDSKIPLAECSAYALAQELVAKGISAVIDISEFETEDRHHFVARFVRGLMKVHKDHWHHVMVFLDESHVFAPQQDRSEAKKAVIDLACRGRKRGYCAIMATNRLSMLNKSVASELQNRMIGQTGLDTDLKRAADELGMGRLHTVATLTNLEPGNFMVYGPALSRTLQRVSVGSVQTSHGIRLGDIRKPTKPTAPMMDEIFANIEEKDEDQANEVVAGETRAAAVAAAAARRDEVRAQIAKQRAAILGPILATAEHSPERPAAITHAATAAGLNRQTIHNWLVRYDPADPLGSLAPSRVPRNMPHTASAARQESPKRGSRTASAAMTGRGTGKTAGPATKARAPRKKIIRLRVPPRR